jgi:hypothetical protein
LHDHEGRLEEDAASCAAASTWLEQWRLTFELGSRALTRPLIFRKKIDRLANGSPYRSSWAQEIVGATG